MRLSEFTCHALEELIDHESCCAADHPLTETCDRPAGADVTGVTQRRAGIVRGELDRAFAFHEPGLPLPLTVILYSDVG